MTTPANRLAICAVCHLPEADPRNLQECFECGDTFHLNPRNDQDGLDCGDAWIGESLGVEYFCQPCIDRLQAASMLGHASPELARHADMMQTVAPGRVPGGPPAPSAPARRGEPPPKPERPRVRRRYRRIDQ